MSESEIVQKCTDATNNTHSLIQSNKNCSWMIKSNWINKTEYYTNGMLKNTKININKKREKEREKCNVIEFIFLVFVEAKCTKLHLAKTTTTL